MAPPHHGLLDHSEVGIWVGPIKLLHLADGQYLSSEQAGDDFTFEEGVNANSVLIKVGSAVWLTTVTIMKSSTRDNGILWALRKLGLQRKGAFPFPLSIRHRATILASTTAVIRRAPTVAYSRSGADAQAWSFICPGFDGVLSGFELDDALPFPEEILALA